MAQNQNEASLLVTAALFPTATQASPLRGGQSPAAAPASAATTSAPPPGLALMKFWESLESLKAASNARATASTTTDDDDNAGKPQSASPPALSPLLPTPTSALDVDQRLTNAIHRHVTDPALIPQLLQPLKLSHDIIPKLKRILEQRAALAILAAELRAEGEVVRRKTAVSGAAVSAASAASTTDAGASSGETSVAEAIKKEEDTGMKGEEGDDDKSKIALVPPSGNDDESDNANSGAGAALLPTPAPPASSSSAVVPTSSGEGLLKHPDLAAWEAYEAETVKYISAQHAHLDALAESIRAGYQLWRSEVDFFRQQQQQ